MVRHRRSLTEISIIIAIVIVGLYLALEYDFFRQEGHETQQRETVELDEALLLGGIVSVCLLVFAIRRFQEQKKEVVRRTAAEQHIRVLAFQDTLTGLPNRRRFEDALRAAIASPPHEGGNHAILMLDLNGFKQINDVHGHAAGDELLTVVAGRLLSVMREGDLVARLGGDEFAVLATHLINPDTATNIALRIIDALKDPIIIGRSKHLVGSGIGIALIPSDAITSEEAFRKADLALYRAKEDRRSAMHFYENSLDQRMRERDWIERELRNAVAAGQIQPYFEPIVDLGTGQITGFEALPRWLHPARGEISWNRFIAIAEESGLIHEIMDHILRRACEAAVLWPASTILAIDILPSQLKDGSLGTRILEVLNALELPAQRLELEITEAALVRDLGAAQLVLGSLREAGVRIALDNFGTGYSSLYHLRNFKLDKIKIDSRFIHAMRGTNSSHGIQDIEVNGPEVAEGQSGIGNESARIVSALVGLARGLGLTIAAEGVLDSSQQSSLLLTGCQQGQGDLYGQPLSLEQTISIFGTQITLE